MSKETVPLSRLEVETSSVSPNVFQIATAALLWMPVCLFLRSSQSARLFLSRALPHPSASPTYCLDPRVSAAAGDRASVADFQRGVVYLSEYFALGMKLRAGPRLCHGNPWTAAKDNRSSEEKQDSTCFSILLNSSRSYKCLCLGQKAKNQPRMYSSEQLQWGWSSQQQRYLFPRLYPWSHFCAICTITSSTATSPPAICESLNTEAVFSTPVPPAFRTGTLPTGE